MEKKLKEKIRYLFQGQWAANGQPGNALFSQSPALSYLFNPNWDLAQFFNAFFKTALIAGAMLAVLRLGYAGFIYMTTDSFGKLGDARQIIQDTVIGLLLLLSIWLILYQINPNILNLNILQNVSGLPAQNQPAAGPAQPADPRFGGNIPGQTQFEQSQTAPYMAP